MQSAETTKYKSNTTQEIFVCFSLLIYCCFWLPLGFTKYPDEPQLDVAIVTLMCSLISTITACSLFLISLLCSIKGYQRAAPVFLVPGMLFVAVGEFLFSDQFCATFLNTDYALCFVAECLAFTIYILVSYYFLSMILSRSHFKLGLSDLQSIRAWFGSRVRVKILFCINVCMLVVVLIDANIYGYAMDIQLGNFDFVWLASCLVLGTISSLISLMLLKFQRCVPYIAGKFVLVLLMIFTVATFVFGSLTVWKYRFSLQDGYAQIGNVWIWCVVNVWVLVEFMTEDVNTVIQKKQSNYQYANVAETDFSETETEVPYPENDL